MLDLIPDTTSAVPCACPACDWRGPESALAPVRNYFARVAPGEIAPAGECPACGALAHVAAPSDPVARALAETAREVAAAGGPVARLELCHVAAHVDPETGETACEAPVPADVADFASIYFATLADPLPVLACDLDNVDADGIARACLALARHYGVPVADRRRATAGDPETGEAFRPDGTSGPAAAWTEPAAETAREALRLLLWIRDHGADHGGRACSDAALVFLRDRA